MLHTHLEESKAKLEAHYRADYAKPISTPVTAELSTSSISAHSPQKVDFTSHYNKRMHLNNEDTDEDKLGARLEQIFKTRAERVVFVKGDPDLEYETVAKAIDIAKGAAIDKIGLMTPKIEAGQ